ncbi:uncharacterized protein [Typha angustifolia]|uniref:uncharacterized protein n=1 Tax=Typha angustifolia TaxID=59011 RepID=UPI003C300365
MAHENYDPCFPDQPVVDMYLPIWAKQPSFQSKPAFIWASDSPEGIFWASITYSELNSSVQCIASKLLHTLHRGDTLLILCSPGLRLVQLLFACQRAGLVAVPIIPPDSLSFSPSNQGPAHHHLFRAILQTSPKAAVADTWYITAVTKSKIDMLNKLRWLPTDKFDDKTCNSPYGAYMGCGPEENYLIQYTSGATGIPKPVVVTTGAAAHNARAARKAYDLQPSSIIVSWLPQYHDCGLMFLLLTVITGATCVLTSPAAFLRRPRLWLELVSKFKATCTPVPSFALPLVLKRGNFSHGKLQLELGSLRNLVLINEPINESPVVEFVKEFACVGLNLSSIAPSYGLAENCTFVSTAWRWGTNLPCYKKLLPSARLSYDDEEVQIMVVHEETSEPVEDGVEGEIWVSSTSNAAGYLGHPSLTREVFHGRPRGVAGKCFVRTDDCGVVKGEERYLYVLGRTTDVIGLDHGRTRVHPHYIETAAYYTSPSHLRGGCIAAFGLDSSSSSKRSSVLVVVAELQGRERGVVLGVYRSICDGIREGVMKEEGVRVGWVVLVESGSVPKTTSGKLKRWEAKDKLLGGKFRVVFEVRVGLGEEGESAASCSGSSNRRLSLLSSL